MQFYWINQSRELKKWWFYPQLVDQSSAPYLLFGFISKNTSNTPWSSKSQNEKMVIMIKYGCLFIRKITRLSWWLKLIDLDSTGLCTLLEKAFDVSAEHKHFYIFYFENLFWNSYELRSNFQWSCYEYVNWITHFIQKTSLIFWAATPSFSITI